LGSNYSKGIGFKVDYEKAVYWWKKVSENSNAKTPMALAQCYAIGQGVEKDINQAIYYYKMSSEREFIMDDKMLEQIKNEAEVKW